jgi:hypothetical protein
MRETYLATKHFAFLATNFDGALSKKWSDFAVQN